VSQVQAGSKRHATAMTGGSGMAAGGRSGRHPHCFSADCNCAVCHCFWCRQALYHKRHRLRIFTLGMASLVSSATLQSLGSRVLSPARPAKVACRQATTPAVGWAAAPPRPATSRLVPLSPKQHLHSAAASAASAGSVAADAANAIGLPRSPGAMVDQAAAAVQVNHSR
jgi:hypothetical protein